MVRISFSQVFFFRGEMRDCWRKIGRGEREMGKGQIIEMVTVYRKNLPNNILGSDFHLT